MATEKRLRSTSKNLFWMIAFIAVSSIFPFVIRTLILRTWGMELLGLDSLFNSVLNILNISELGIGSALVFNLYRPVANNDVKMIQKIILLYKRLYLFIGTFMLVSGIAIIPFLPRVIKGTYPTQVNIYVVYLFQLMKCVIGYYVFPETQALFQADQATSITFRNNTFAWFITYMVQVMLILNGCSFYLYAICIPIGAFMFNVTNYFSMHTHYKQFCGGVFLKNNYTKEFKKDLVTRVSAMGLSKIRTVLRNTIDTIIISSMLGLVAVAKYQNYMLIMSIPIMLVGSLTAAVLPSLGNGIAIETVDSNYEVVKITAFIQYWVSVLCSTILAVFYNPFMKIWVGEKNTFPEHTVFLFVLYFYIKIIPNITDLVRNGSGIWKEGCWGSAAESVANLLLSLLLAKKMGVDGVLIGTILTILFINIPIEHHYVYKCYFQRGIKKTMLYYLTETIVAVAITALTYHVCYKYNASFVSTLIVRGLLSITIPNLLLLVVFGRTKQFREAIRLLLRIIF